MKLSLFFGSYLVSFLIFPVAKAELGPTASPPTSVQVIEAKIITNEYDMGGERFFFPSAPKLKKNDEVIIRTETNGEVVWYRATVRTPPTPAFCPGCPAGEASLVITGEIKIDKKNASANNPPEVDDFDFQQDAITKKSEPDPDLDPSRYKEKENKDPNGSFAAATGAALTHGISQLAYRHFVYTSADRKELAKYAKQSQKEIDEIKKNTGMTTDKIIEANETFFRALGNSDEITKQMLNVNEFLDAQEKDTYQWKSPQGDFRDELEEIRNSLNSIKTFDPRRQTAKDLGKKMTEEADTEFSVGNSAEAEFWKDSAKIMGDLAFGWDPYTAFARALYEVPTGKNYFTGKELSAVDRALGVIDILSAGTSGLATNSVRAVSKLVKIGNQVEKGLQAVSKANKIINSKIAKQQGIRQLVKKMKWVNRKNPGLMYGIDAFETLGTIGYDSYGILENVVEGSELQWGGKLTRIPDVSKVKPEILNQFEGPIQKVRLQPGQIIYQLQEPGQKWQGKMFGIVEPGSFDSAEQIKTQVLANPDKPIVKMYRVRYATDVYAGYTNGGQVVQMHIPFDPKSEYLDIMREIKEYDLSE